MAATLSFYGGGSARFRNPKNKRFCCCGCKRVYIWHGLRVLGRSLFFFWGGGGGLQASQSKRIKYKEEFILNSRGSELFTCSWLPANGETKALVFLCHGYALESSTIMFGTGSRLAKAGYAAYGIDYEGHGKSAGLNGYIPCFDHIVDDCSDHFTEISERKENRGKQRFLLGESMGGAVIILLDRKKPGYWDGAVMVAPMCKIADEIHPNPLIINILMKLSKIFPTWKLMPIKNIINIAFREPEKREAIRNNPYCYKGRIRLHTAKLLLRVSFDIQQRLSEVSLPFLVLHGRQDKVTDISASEELYESAFSWDKNFKVYPGMWHSLTYGESLDNIDIVFADILEWLDERSLSPASSPLEQQRKNLYDDHHSYIKQ
ncbi:caffeoylshikimate esterase-like [Malania oleifera]|uniref:caffeoylshikimate esterase-like n=1 Tax=Malania oleifera TaxID=397392 RepID=UPI0025AE5973|nr:caffeoylshikimate esterase-like [Malania oleifera]